jgi:hypothetical protein
VAKGTGTRTRGRWVSEALLTMWQQSNLLLCVLLARALPRSREKLPSEASKVEPPDECRTRVELPELLFLMDRSSLTGTGHQHSTTP